MKFTYLIALLFATKTFAGPVYSTACPGADKIKKPLNSGGYFMDASCKKAYVLPPPVGKMSVAGKTVSDLSRCKEIKQFNKTLKVVNININKAIRNGSDDVAVKDLFDQRRTIINEYSDLSTTLGASVALLFSSGIDESVRLYKKLNSQLGIEFVAVQLKDSQISFNQTNPFDPEISSLIDKKLQVRNLDEVGPGSFSVNANLNLNGACPLVDPFEGTIGTINPEDISGIVTPNMIYKYEVGATYKYKASFNLAALAKKIVNVSSKGGFFKTSSTASLTESTNSSSWFKLEMSCDDSRVCDQAKQETALEIKNRLIKQVLDEVAITTIGYSVTPGTAAEPGKNGASSSADALRKCPNPYCQAAAVVLDVASSIFGGTSKTDEFIKRNDFFTEEVVTENRPIQFIGMMGFEGKGK